MQLRLSRVILFTANMDQMAAFYRDVLGFALKADDRGWKTLDAGSCEIALHSGGRKPGPRSPKLQFDVKDVAATRDWLIARGEDGEDVQHGRTRPVQRQGPGRQSVLAVEQRAEWMMGL
ncbi:MAG: VOC family protein [Dongiaceae bacterium]